MTKIIAVMPLKLQNERLPGKNTKMLGDKPLLRYQLDVLSDIDMIDDIYVYCSNDIIESFLPSKVSFMRRDPSLDLPTSNFTQIFTSFMNEVDADIYIYAHATAPFIKRETIIEEINEVLNKGYDSAFCAVKIQDFLWRNGNPLNFDAEDLPRSQDLDIIYRETSGVYVFKKEVFTQLGRRIGSNPYIHEATFKESIDINTSADFKLAELLLNVDLEESDIS